MDIGVFVVCRVRRCAGREWLVTRQGSRGESICRWGHSQARFLRCLRAHTGLGAW
jgi:hypothetical protein